LPSYIVPGVRVITFFISSLSYVGSLRRLLLLQKEHHNAEKSLHDDAVKLAMMREEQTGKIADILVKMTKSLNSPEYCEGINKYNVRGIYEVWARKILEVCG
jgi:negative regulator of replication initiation